MGIFLNSTAPFEAYKITALDKYFVDKTMLIEELIPSIGREQRFLCITRPRQIRKDRNGKYGSVIFWQGNR